MDALITSMVGEHPARTCLVISNRPDAAGLEIARAYGVTALSVDHREGKTRGEFEAALHAALTNATPDIICLAGFMRILSGEFIDHWRGQILNIHPSLLPRYPGLNTHRRALDAGDKTHGCTVHEVTGALDSGPILGKAVVPVHASDTETTLAARVLEAEHRLYPEVLCRVAKGDRRVLHLS